MPTWEDIIRDIIGSRESVSTEKLVKRAAKRAKKEGLFPDASRKTLRRVLAKVIGRNGVPGFEEINGRVRPTLASSIVQNVSLNDNSGSGSREIYENGRSSKKRKMAEVGIPPFMQPTNERNYPNPMSGTSNLRLEREIPAINEEHNYSPRLRQDEVCVSDAAVETGDQQRWRSSLQRNDVKSGRFSDTEKDKLRKAVIDYAVANGFSTTDFSWLIVPGKGKRQTESKSTMGMWKEVAKALPDRTIKSVSAAGWRIFHPNAKKGTWTAEEDSKLLELSEQLGHKWSTIATTIGRTAEACRDRWKEVKLKGAKRRGPWNLDEEQRLKDAVESYLDNKRRGDASASRSQGEGSLRREVLDDVNWDAISTAVGTRSGLQCMEKWYDQMRPSMVSTGEWGIGDDRRLLRALYCLQPKAEFEVPWEEAVPGRTSIQTRRRWRLMLKSVKDFRNKTMWQCVNELVSKHLPHLKDRLPAPAEHAFD